MSEGGRFERALDGVINENLLVVWFATERISTRKISIVGAHSTF